MPEELPANWEIMQGFATAGERVRRWKTGNLAAVQPLGVVQNVQA